MQTEQHSVSMVYGFFQVSVYIRCSPQVFLAVILDTDTSQFLFILTTKLMTLSVIWRGYCSEVNMRFPKCRLDAPHIWFNTLQLTRWKLTNTLKCRNLFIFFLYAQSYHIYYGRRVPYSQNLNSHRCFRFRNPWWKNVPILIKSPNLIAVFHVIPGIKNAAQTKEERINEHMKKIANG